MIDFFQVCIFSPYLSALLYSIDFVILLILLILLLHFHLFNISVNQVGEEGLCKSSIFLSYPFGETQRYSGIDATVKSGAEISDTIQSQSSKGSSRKEGKKLKDVNQSDIVSISGGGSNVTDSFTARCTFNVAVCGVAVECGGCGIKLGRFSPQDSPCSCGILVPGPALRITATKVNAVLVPFFLFNLFQFNSAHPDPRGYQKYHHYTLTFTTPYHIT